MKLLILASGGADAHRRALVALVDAARAGADVRALAPDAEGKLLRPLGVPVESWKPAGLFNVLRSIGALRRAVEYHDPDVVHAIGWTAAAVALGALAPALTSRTVVTLLEPIREGDIPKGFVEKRLPELLQRAGFAVVAYQTLATELIERFDVSPERIAVIAPGVAPTLQPGTLRPLEREGPVLGFLGRLDNDKVWEQVIDTLVLVKRQFPAARLWFASSGPARNLVRAYARGRGVEHEVTFFDDLPPREFLTGVDIVAVPQGRDGLPYALLQALVDGVPAVATNHEGLSDTLGPYDVGWLVPEGPGGLTAGVVDAWPRIDAAWRGAQAQRALAIASYDPAAVAQRYDALYDDLAASGGEAAVAPRSEGLG